MLIIILFLECWDHEPDNRPNIKQVVEKLNVLLSQDQSIQDLEEMPIYDKTTNEMQNDSKITNIIVKGSVELLIKVINEGKYRELRHSILDNYLSLHSVTTEEIYGWLYENQMKNLNCIFFMGYSNFSEFGTTLDINKAFNYFHQASL